MIEKHVILLYMHNEKMDKRRVFHNIGLLNNTIILY